MDQEALARRLRETFALEVEEQVEVLNRELLSLEERPSDVEGLRSVFRVVHSLKGASRAAGVRILERACHRLEGRLALLRKTGGAPNEGDFQRLFTFADGLAEVSRRLREDSDLAGALSDELLNGAEDDGASSASGRPRQSPPEVPSRPATHAEEEAGDAGRERSPRRQHVRVDTDRLDRLLASTSELMMETAAAERYAKEVADLADDIAGVLSSWRSARTPRWREGNGTASSSVLRAPGRLDRELDRVSRAAFTAARHARQGGRSLAGSVRKVEEDVMGLRLRAFGDSVEPLQRTVRDLARDRNKEARLEVEGAAVEVDRAVLDALAEPLLHLVRNAVDHGIEPPEVRRAVGKAAHGTIRISAGLQGSRVVVTVSDDGGGVDTAAVREAMAEAGVVGPEDPEALLDTLLDAGISTRTTADAISGRGLGLEIVRHALQKIHGSVRVSSKPGQGTSFVLECPPSLNTLRAVVVKAGGSAFAVPTMNVDRLVRVRRDELGRVGGRWVLRGEEGPVALTTLAGLLGPPLVQRPLEDVVTVVMIQGGRSRLAVVVEEVLGESELVLRPGWDEQVASTVVSGVAVVDGGRVATVLDVSGLLSSHSERGIDVSVAPSATARHSRILVADDSITTRTLEESVLVAAGYAVTTAVDGAEAWRALQEGRYDLVVADVDMPRMDGFDLCRAVRSAAATRDVPVILVTSMDSPEHRRQGMEAGADAYIGKSGFDQEELLATIRQLID